MVPPTALSKVYLSAGSEHQLTHFASTVDLPQLKPFSNVNIDINAYLCAVENGQQPLTKLHYMGLALYVCVCK